MGVTAGLTLLAVLVGVGGAATVVWFSARPELSTSSVVVRSGCIVAAAGIVGSFVVLAVLPVDAFAVAHLLYLLVVVTVPMVGIGCAIAWVRNRPRTALAVLAPILLVPGLLGAYATHVAPYRLHEDRATVTVPDVRAPEHPLRIGVMSDLQMRRVTDYERGAVDRLMAREPDLILIAGDLFQGSQAEFERELEPYRALLGKLHAPGGVFVVQGDVDAAETDLLVEGTDVQVLHDQVARVEVEGRTVNIGGTRLHWMSDASTPVYEQLEAAPADEIAILLSHRPDTVTRLSPDSRVDLTVAGHTHGGQIAIPFFGPPVTLSELPRSIGAGGLHEHEGNPIYVCTGLGLERGQAPQVRFFTRPSFGIIDLVGAPSS